VDFAEDGDSVHSRAVPASVSELLLTLLYGDDCAGLDCFHHFNMAPTHVLLTTHQTHQTVTLVLRTDVT